MKCTSEMLLQPDASLHTAGSLTLHHWDTLDCCESFNIAFFTTPNTKYRDDGKPADYITIRFLKRYYLKNIQGKQLDFDYVVVKGMYFWLDETGDVEKTCADVEALLEFDAQVAAAAKASDK